MAELEGWQQSAIVLGVIATILTILGRLWRFPIRWMAAGIRKGAVWSGRTLVLALIRSDNKQAKKLVRTLLDEELGILKKVSVDVIQVEGRLATLEESVKALTRDYRADITLINWRVDRSLLEVRNMVKQITETAIPSIHRTLHTLLGAVAGPEEVQKAVREQLLAAHEEERRKKEDER